MKLAANSPLAQDREHLLSDLHGGCIVPQVVDFIGVVPEVKQLSVGGVEEVYKLPLLVPDHGHELRSRQNSVLSLFSKHDFAEVGR